MLCLVSFIGSNCETTEVIFKKVLQTQDQMQGNCHTFFMISNNNNAYNEFLTGSDFVPYFTPNTSSTHLISQRKFHYQLERCEENMLQSNPWL